MSKHLISRIVAACAVLCLCAPASWAQADKFFDAWRWTHFTTESGLPDEEVLDLVETGDGTTWIRCSQTIAWFDGFRWITLDGLPGSPTALDALGESDVLIVAGGKLLRGDRDSLRELAPRSPSGSVPIFRSVYSIGPQACVLLTTGPASTSWTLQLDGTSLAAAGVPIDVVTMLGRAPFWSMRDQSLWVNAAGGLYKWTPAGPQIMLPIDGRPHLVGSVTGDARGNALAYVDYPVSVRGIWEWSADGERTRLPATEGGQMIRTMDLAPDGTALVVYESDQIRLRERGVWRSVLPAIPELTELSLARFRTNGDIWIASREGLSLFRGSSQLWTEIKRAELSELNSVHEILQTSDGSIWIGTRSGLEIHSPDGAVRSVHEIDGTPLLSVTAIGEDERGHVWVGSGDSFPGAYRWDGSSWRHFGADDGLAAPAVHKIRADRSGRLWFLGIADPGDPYLAAVGPGAFVHDGGSFRRWGRPEGLQSGRVYAFVEAADGAFWFGTGVGLSRYQHGSWRHWTDPDLPAQRVFALAAAPDGGIWVSCLDSGLLHWNGDEFTSITTADGLPGDVVWEVKTGADGYSWACTDGGLAVHDGHDWIAIGKADGALRARLWPLLVTDDRLMIGTQGEGTRVLDLTQLRQSSVRLSLPHVTFDAGGAVHLTWTAAASFGALSGDWVKTRTSLDGGPWSLWGSTRELRPARIATGPHSLRVQAHIPLATQASVEQVLEFDIAPTLIKRPGFLIPIATLFLLLASFGCYHVVRLRRSVTALRRSESKLSKLFDHSRDGILLLDAAGEVLEANQAALDLFGAQPRDVLGQRLAALSIKTADKSIDELLAASLEAPALRFTCEVSGHASGPLQADVSTGHFKVAGQTVLLAMMRDITERVQLEMRLRQSQKMEALGRLSGGIAHDFNNLLTVISGYAELLLKSRANESGGEELTEIRNAATRASTLTRQLLAFSRQQVLRPIVLDPNAILEDMQQMLRRLIGENINLEIQLQSTSQIRADPGQLEQVILNLAINARDAMPQGGTLTLQSVDQHTAEGGRVRIRISDTGRGMDQRNLTHLFEPFYTTKELGEGTGLGLSTVYGIVTQSGGEIEVASEPELGSRFDIYFPSVAPGHRSEEEALHEQRDPVGLETILVVEDEPAVRALACVFLQEGGYQILEAQGAEQAAEIARTHGAPIDLLLTDVVMPRKSGLQLADELVLLHPNMRVLYMTGYVPEAVIKNRDMGLDLNCLTKPFTTSQLLRMVRSTLDARPVATASRPGPG